MTCDCAVCGSPTSEHVALTWALGWSQRIWAPMPPEWSRVTCRGCLRVYCEACASRWRTWRHCLRCAAWADEAYWAELEAEVMQRSRRTERHRHSDDGPGTQHPS